jgi:hypothetical protein
VKLEQLEVLELQEELVLLVLKESKALQDKLVLPVLIQLFLVRLVLLEELAQLGPLALS